MKHILRLLAKFVLLPLGVSISSIAYAQTDMMNAILERLTAGIQKLETSCGEDIKKYCSTVTPGDGRILYCMQAHEDKISPACAYDLNEVELQVQTTADHLREAVNACRGDIDKFCAKTQPGQGRIAACLAANRTSVSKSCVEAVQNLQER
jgi:4-hydroxyphenylpyruvate dioxygenase-like putative hemolysin